MQKSQNTIEKEQSGIYSNEMENDAIKRDVEGLTSSVYDALIVGGGIKGAGITRDLALRGLRAALVAKVDFASGTSSSSTKLIHGGLRSLENFDLQLAFESCRERRILQQIASGASSLIFYSGLQR